MSCKGTGYVVLKTCSNVYVGVRHHSRQVRGRTYIFSRRKHDIHMWWLPGRTPWFKQWTVKAGFLSTCMYSSMYRRATSGSAQYDVSVAVRSRRIDVFKEKSRSMVSNSCFTQSFTVALVGYKLEITYIIRSHQHCLLIFWHTAAVSFKVIEMSTQHHCSHVHFVSEHRVFRTAHKKKTQNRAGLPVVKQEPYKVRSYSTSSESLK